MPQGLSEEQKSYKIFNEIMAIDTRAWVSGKVRLAVLWASGGVDKTGIGSRVTGELSHWSQDCRCPPAHEAFSRGEVALAAQRAALFHPFDFDRVPFFEMTRL